MPDKILLGVCWVLVIAVWFVGAIYNAFAAPPTERYSTGRMTSAPAGLLLVALIYATYKFIPAEVWEPLTVRSGVLWAVGAALLIGGTVFTLWARWVLGTMWAATAVAKQGHALRTSGPYAITRHPIYTGLLTMLVGTALLEGLGIWVLGLAIAVAVIELKIYQEERLLLETLGEPYARYREQVPQLIPGLKPPG